MKAKLHIEENNMDMPNTLTLISRVKYKQDIGIANIYYI